jgi:hypothetical protein
MSAPIRALFEKSIDRHIEGVIKADDEADLLNEVSEYVVTREISKRLDELLGAYLEGGVANGVWIAGFFGSGKSHLLKILSVLLENRLVGGARVADLFLPKLADDPMLKADLEKAVRIPSRSVRFNIDQKADLIAKDQVDALLAVFVKVFNELRGYYPKQGYIAEIEAELDGRGQFELFKEAYLGESRGRAWESERDIVHTLENETFARAYAKVTGMGYGEALQALDRKQAAYRVSIESFAETVQTWLERQPAGFRLNFFVDEVGQFIGTNSKLMLNLQTVAETLATKCKGRAWLFVTSQGDLETVIGDMGAGANDFTKIQGRFKTLLNLTSQDVAEVISRRLLFKVPEQPPALVALHRADGANLRMLFQFGDNSRTFRGWADEAEFCAYYPFHPYQFELLQLALISLSRHGFFTGRARSIGERSMLGILQDVVKSIGDEEPGVLAAFDGMFEGIRNSLRGDLQSSVLMAERQLGGAGMLPVRVLKALFLVKFVQQFKSTVRNIAILLIDRCDVDIAGHEKAVLGALNLLESQTYIQRSGDIYEYLTNEEQAVETEIKETEVDETAISDQLARILFEDIIREAKFRFEENKQDYPVTRRLDGQVYKREYDLGFHVATPLHENYGDSVSMAAQTMGRAEVLMVLPEDVHLLSDLRLYLQTEKYARQTLSPTIPEARRRIIVDKQQRNAERLRSLHEHLGDSLCRARLVLNGSPLEVNASDPRHRVAKAFQELVRYAFPSLRMLRRVFAEGDLREILQTPADDFFKNDEGTLGEAEQEIMLKLQAARSTGTRVTVSDQISQFERRPYGWSQTATLCLTARLFMRGKVELRNGGNVLTAAEALTMLSNNRHFATTVITPQEQFDAAAVTKLRRFHQEFFDAAPVSMEAREVAQEFQERLKEQAAALETLASHADAYPFLSALTPWIGELRELAGREWSYCLKNLSEFSERLLDAKEATLDPLRQFHSGPRRGIYDDIRGFLSGEQANFGDFEGPEIRELEAVLASPAPYKGNVLQVAKATLEAARGKVAAIVAAAREDAAGRVQRAMEKLSAIADNGRLRMDSAEDLTKPFREALQRIAATPLAPVIREIAERIETQTLPRQLEELARRETEGLSGPAAAEVRYIPAGGIRVRSPKAVLESAEDLEAYLAALRVAYTEQIEAGKRITL